jgi:HSP20 family protein
MFLVPLSRKASLLARPFDSLFDDRFDRFLAPAKTDTQAPALDVTESDRAYTIRLDLPGVAKDEVKVSIEGRRVRIEAQAAHKEEKTDGDRIVYRERSASSFARSFVLAAEIDQAASAAKLEHGVLTLTLAKRGAAATQITVN